MREIEGKKFTHLDLIKNNENQDISFEKPLLVDTYIDLVKKIACLSYENKDNLLFYRGQSIDYLNRAKNSSFYPRIYRTESENLTKDLLSYRFKLLEQASALLVKKFEDNNIDISRKELKKRKYIQWSILQHYEVCDTPFLDLTQSIRVACSFALSDNNDFGYFFVFGLPYISNRISINSEHDLINIRLINICPPEALRPHFQEGYLVGTDIEFLNFEDKTEFDFKRRLIAKFKIPNNKKFWGEENTLNKYLKQKDDKVGDICMEIVDLLKNENNIELMFPGIWQNKFELPNGKIGVENVQIKNGNKYYKNDKHIFNIDSVIIDKQNKKIEFRKFSVIDSRRNSEYLDIINENEYSGYGSHGSKVKYTKISSE